ncbi:MAG: sulfurtransferase [Pigmentiphaga sp.]
MSVLNIAAYHFVELDELPALRLRLFEQAAGHSLRGTILLAPEGINLFLAGPDEAIRSFLTQLRADPRFAALHAKFSSSAQVPFRRLRVRIKREIIRMDHPTIQPGEGRAPSVDALTLQRWLAAGHDDNGRPVLVLDTRNGFEVEAGTFRDALHLGIERFTQFPAAVTAHREALVGKAVVTFCTGGIRCEKAALFMAEAGIESVYQLEGGILQYFEDTDGRDFDGRCFVFDGRVALDPALRPQEEQHR